MAEAELHRERLQAIAEKRKRQAAIEDKRQQLEDQILQLQHLKSKLLREKWLMQGVPASSLEEEEARNRQCEEDDQKLKIHEENVQRLEQDIEQLESEESLISAKEQILREKLKETEVSFLDLQKSLKNQDKDAVNYIYSQIPDLTNIYSHQESPLICDGTTKVPGSKKKIVQFRDVEKPEEQETSIVQLTRPPIPEDDIKLKRDKEQISANHSKPIDIVLTSNETMDFEVSEPRGVTVVSSDLVADNQSNLLSTAASHNGLKDRHESLDSDVAKEIQYLDDVLEANCCDAADNPFNGSTSPEPTATITVDGSSPFVSISNDCFAPEMDIIVVDRKPLPVVEIDKSTESVESIKINGHSREELKDDHADIFTYPASPNSSNSSRRSSKDGENIPKVIKKEAKFELRAFHEEKKPSKLFEDFNEKEHIRVRKVRPSEEVVELEKERIELIKSQAVKKNPGIATKWWNPPQEKTIEEQLDSDHLESHLKYKERKQKQQTVPSPPNKSVSVSPVPSETSPTVNKEDVVTEQIDFSAARKQFLNMENTSQTSFRAPPKRSVASNLFSVKPFYKVSHDNKAQSSVTPTNPFNECETVKPDDVSLVKAEKVLCSSEDQQRTDQTPLPKSSSEHSGEALTEDHEFVSASAKFTVVKDDDPDISDQIIKSVIVCSIPEELDSGLDDLSLKSQDTTVMETLSNDFSMDNISDSGASNETINTLHEHSLGDFSQPHTPLHENDYTVEGVSKSFSDQGFSSPSSMHDSIASEDPIEYQAGVLVQNVIQQALSEKAGIRNYSIQEHPAVPNHERREDFNEQKDIVKDDSRPYTPEGQDETIFEPPQISSPVQQTRGTAVTPEASEQEPPTKQHRIPEPLSIPPVTEEDPIEETRQESYFSKYSQAAELRSTASILATQESEVTVGPFKLRSRKQRTLSMIEEEIRAAQEREQELKKQRQRQSLQSPTSPSSKNVPVMPTRTASYKTAPGKIEKVRTSSTSKAECSPTPPEVLLEDATGSQRPRNLMQTLMDDFETLKSKRRDRVDESTYTSKLLSYRVTTEVLEAVRVSRRKSAQALRWEAGIYANREEDE
ncbi:A-kinase anchor protein 2 isoform X1 [Rana temporaria]|uniref:A-kinase anchor protein 2 isoform X1 n=2 Tax=Rana temporaria TaxID=8407 RepID=UPI001AAD5CB5|nr:A-kinase anchor protein 2 isoform X1 [Rana temporaria]